MKSSRIGVIDLGTNTFHLLVIDWDGGPGFKEIHRERRFIKLAEGGISKIADAPYQRGLDAMHAYRRTLDKLDVNHVKAIGTAALRTASNGPDFIKTVAAETGIQVELISGNREAALIHQGVSLAVPLGEHPDLIMDIGGGSVEFILANKEQVYWSQSFPLGVAVLFREFHLSEPIASNEISTLEQFLKKTLQPLWEHGQEYTPVRLIGASGTFDVLENILADGRSHPFHAIVSLEKFFPLAEEIIAMDRAERLEVEGVPSSRADMIVVALLLVRIVLENLPIKDLVVSEYAMKEGMIAELKAIT